MSKTWKIVLIVLAVLVALAATAFFWGKSVWDKISFGKPRLVNLSLNGLTASDIANIAFGGGTKEVTASIAMDVINKNNFSISFSSLKVELLYNGQTIAITSDMLSGAQKVPANGTLTVTDTVKVILNNAGGQLLLEKIKGNKVQVEYKVMVKLFGIPIPKSLQTQSFEF